MADAVSRWALLTSVALHIGAFALTLVRPSHSAVPKVTLADFWAGTTFEVPEHFGDLAWATAASEASDSANEINVEGVDPSGPTRTASARSPAAGGPVERGAEATEAAAMAALSPNAASRSKGRGVGHPRGESRAAPAASGGVASLASNGSASSGTFGAEGAAAGVRDLVRSFVRAIPIVASSDPIWASLPLGSAGSADLTIGLDAEGKPFAAQPPESASPAHLRRLVQKTLSVMAGGRFAAPPSDAPAAEQKIRIAIALTQQDPPAERDVASGGAFSLRFEPADAHHVSRAFFTLASGRRVEVSVRQLSVH